MTMKKFTVILFWYFFFQSQGSATVIGPFPSQKACDNIRGQFIAISVIDIVTPCWSDS